MAHADSALDTLPPARQRASEAYLRGTVVTGAENTRRGRSGARSRPGAGGRECSLPAAGRGRERGGQPLPARARTATGGAAARGLRGAGTHHPRGARAQRCPRARPALASAAPAPCFASAAAGGPQNLGRSCARTGSGLRAGLGKNRRSHAGSKSTRGAEGPAPGSRIRPGDPEQRVRSAEFPGPRRKYVPLGHGRSCSRQEPEDLWPN